MKHQRITNILLFIIALLLATYVFIVLRDRGTIDVKINTAVAKAISKVKIPPPQKPKDGRTPIKNVDYFDGVNGKNATDEQVQKAVSNYFKDHPVKQPKTPPKAKDGKDGITPEPRCNVIANRWEVRYGPDQSWQLLNGERIRCTVEIENE